MNAELEFDLESKLLAVLEGGVRSHSGNPFAKDGTELIVVRESAIGSTIPDLIVIRKLMLGAVGKRVKLTAFQSWVLGELLRTGELSEVVLSRRLFSRVESTRAALQKLERVGVVRRTENGTYLVTADLCSTFEIVSVEAKLTRWRSAIEQAKSYLRFSDETFIALPASVIIRNHQIEGRCREEGVGLIAVTALEVRAVLQSRRKVQPDRSAWTWALAKSGALTV